MKRQDIESIKLNKNNYIFGIGDVGEELCKCFLLLQGINIKGFIVSDNYKLPSIVEGIPVYSVTEYSKICTDKDNVFIALYMNHDKAIMDLKNHQCNKGNIIKINYTKDISFLKSIYLKEYLTKKSIDLSQKNVDLNGVIVPNPFIQDDEYLVSWCIEVGDILWPSIFNDNMLINDGSYEYEDVFLNDGDVVFDCGANIGLFSILSASKKCTSYAFEPVPKIQKLLEKAVHNYCEWINIIPYALGEQTAEEKFFIQPGNLAGGTVLEMPSKYKGEPIQVHITTIDEFVEKNKIDKVDFIKADIEGAERFMLKGAKETLRKYAPKLSICTYHLEDDPEVLENLILEANPNYIVKHHWKKLFAHVPNKL